MSSKNLNSIGEKAGAEQNIRLLEICHSVILFKDFLTKTYCVNFQTNTEIQRIVCEPPHAHALAFISVANLTFHQPPPKSIPLLVFKANPRSNIPSHA